jgi:pimeloyl-ACP methyl ester carboxylesterase
MTTQSPTQTPSEGLPSDTPKVGRHLPLLPLRRSVRPAFTLAPAIRADRNTLRSGRGHVLSYYEDRHVQGRPLVLLHSVNACASAYDMKPLFERFRPTRSVFALDLPGFGFSQRDAQPFSPELYTDDLVDFLSYVTNQAGSPDVVALSLSCEFAARAAMLRKDLVHSLSFLSPTGLQAAPAGRRRSRDRAAESGGSATVPWWGRLAFEAIACRPSIRYFLGKSFVGPVDPGLRSYAYDTSHQPGAEYAPLAFVSGKLFTEGIDKIYAKLERPVLVLYDRDGYTRFDLLPEMVGRYCMWEAKRISPTLGMPQFERLDDTASALEEFWSAQAPAFDLMDS